MSRVIAVDFDLAESQGLNAAVTHQQIQWAIEAAEFFGVEQHAEGWLTCKLSRLTRFIPLSRDQIWRALQKLEEADLVESKKFRAALGDQTVSYRPIPYRASAISGDGASAKNRFRASAISSEEDGADGTEDSPPTPPGEGKRPSAAALFDEWWGKPRRPGLYPAKVGSRSKAKERFRQTLRNWDWDFIATCTRNYAEARDGFHARHGVHPPLLHAETFLNAKERFTDWDEPWSDAKADSFWGRAVPQAKRRIGASAEEIEAALADEEDPFSGS